ncbi:hypothetical protein CgunFtcFv8_010645 [Champsocephalus gunnari]|uniref:Uncharacterized protein n=1 Tax=Champsocephalus gunnari TaxID=52237 RepID=A0AAN8DW34_CHAGU|nr:hypothetical protein CgunFtcFv8_010645 [Champsocephalus gunnari]
MAPWHMEALATSPMADVHAQREEKTPTNPHPHPSSHLRITFIPLSFTHHPPTSTARFISHSLAFPSSLPLYLTSILPIISFRLPSSLPLYLTSILPIISFRLPSSQSISSRPLVPELAGDEREELCVVFCELDCSRAVG